MNKWVIITGVILLVFGFMLYSYSKPVENLYFAPSETSDKPYFPIGVVTLILGFLVLIIGMFYKNPNEN